MATEDTPIYWFMGGAVVLAAIMSILDKWWPK